MKNNVRIGGTNQEVIKLGKGSPKVLIVAGIHGDEYSQQLVLAKLMAGLDIACGQLTILPRLNPLGLDKNQESNPLDGKNINRVFPGSVEGSSSEQIASFLSDLSLQQDLVIDLHNFTNPSCVQAIYFHLPNNPAAKRSLKLCKLFRPEQIWKVDITKKDQKEKLGNTLVGFLISRGVAALGIELPPVEALEASQVDEATLGLKRLLSFQKILPPENMRARKVVMVERRDILAPGDGIFLPRARLRQRVSKNHVIGQLISLSSSAKILVNSPQDGLIVNLSGSRFVHKGDKLGSLGINQTTL